MTITSPTPPPPPLTPTAPTVTRRPGSSPVQTGVILGIAAIMMSFAALTSALVVRQAEAPDWQHFHLPVLLYWNTLVLLVSSGTLEIARRDVRHQRHTWLLVTLALGLLFLAGQLLAWRSLWIQGLYLATSPSSAFLYLFTALHGLHVVGGLTALAYVSYRVRRATVAEAQVVVGAASWYWHFMAGLWVYLLTILALRI